MALLAIWWLLTPLERRPLRPSETVRALKSRLKLKRPAPAPSAPPKLRPRPLPAVPAPPSGEPLALRVRLRRTYEPDVEMDDSWYELSLPESYWPHTDEVDWPDLPSVDGLQALADAGTELQMRKHAPFLSDPDETWIAGREAVHGVLDQAEADGIFGSEPVWERYQEDDPWALLHQAQVHRAAELVTSYDGRPRTGFTQRGFLSETRFLANRLVDADPDHPAADYARLMLLEAATWDTDEDFRLREPQLAVDTIVQTLEASDDPLVTQSAMVSLLLTDHDDLALADVGPLLDTLEAEVDGLPNELREGVAAVSLALAIQTDTDRAQVWLDLLEGADPDREGAVFDRDAIDEAYGRLVQAGARQPQTWSEDLRARVVACHADDPVPEASYQLSGRWEEGWHFEEVTETDVELEPLPAGFLGCLGAGTWNHPPPASELSLNVDGSTPLF